MTDERLTAGEIKVRAEHTIGRFYWSPAVSHIRRELTRLLRAGLVAEQRVDVGARSMTVHGITDLGENLLSKWASAIPESDLIVKHPLMLRIWLSRDPDPAALLQAIDRYIERLDESIQKANWSVRRSREVGYPVNDPVPRSTPGLACPAATAVASSTPSWPTSASCADEIAWTMSEKPPSATCTCRRRSCASATATKPTRCN